MLRQRLGPFNPLPAVLLFRSRTGSPKWRNGFPLGFPLKPPPKGHPQKTTHPTCLKIFVQTVLCGCPLIQATEPEIPPKRNLPLVKSWLGVDVRGYFPLGFKYQSVPLRNEKLHLGNVSIPGETTRPKEGRTSGPKARKGCS